MPPNKAANVYVGLVRSPLRTLLWCVLTLGIYVPIYLLLVTDDLNKSLGEDRMSSVWALVSSLCLAPLSVIWLVRIAFALADVENRRGIDAAPAVNLALVLVLLPPAGIFWLQVRLNRVWSTAPSRRATSSDTETSQSETKG